MFRPAKRPGALVNLSVTPLNYGSMKYLSFRKQIIAETEFWFEKLHLKYHLRRLLLSEIIFELVISINF